MSCVSCYRLYKLYKNRAFEDRVMCVSCVCHVILQKQSVKTTIIQYLVHAPLFLMTASILLGSDEIVLSINAGLVDCIVSATRVAKLCVGLLFNSSIQRVVFKFSSNDMKHILNRIEVRAASWNAKHCTPKLLPRLLCGFCILPWVPILKPFGTVHIFYTAVCKRF